MGATLLAMASSVRCAASIRYVPAVASLGPFLESVPRIVAGTRELLPNAHLALAVVGISWFWFIGALFQLALLLAGGNSACR